MTTLHIGSDSEYIKIRFPTSLGRDGWVETQVELSVNAFQGNITPCFEVADFEQFLSELTALNETLQGRADLSPREQQFVLALVIDPTGHILVTGEAWSRTTYENKLQFEFVLDQTFLSKPMDQLQSILGARETDA